MAKTNSGRNSGGITGTGGNKVTPIYKQSIPPASVKIIPPMSDVARGIKNSVTSRNLESAKSGNAAALHNKISNDMNAGKPSKTIKINSGRGSMGGGGLNINKVR